MRPRGVVAILGLLFFGVFLWKVADILSPVLVALLVWYFLYPLRRSPWGMRVLITTVTLLILWFLHRAWTALVPFAWGGAVAYLLDPFVDRLQRLHIPRFLGALILVLTLVSLLVAIGLLVLPTAASQISDIIQQLPEAATATQQWLTRFQERFDRLGLPIRTIDLQQRILSADTILSRVAQGALDITKALSGALSRVINLILVIVVSFYLLVGIDTLTEWCGSLVPPGRRSQAAAVFHDIDAVIGAWFRGQLLVAVLVGLLTALGLAALSTPYAALIGLVAGVLNIIPTIGLIMSVVIAVLLAPTVAHPLVYLVKVGVVFAVVQTLDSVVISAQVMRARMGLHPAVVILAVVVFATLFGAAGVLIAVPAAALLRLGGHYALARYRTSEFFAQSPPSPSKEKTSDAT